MSNTKFYRVKILILGPVKSGKTAIANYLADSREITSLNYRPTQGARIVEFESNKVTLNDERIEADIELWDCSGDPQYEKCWPAIRRHAHGVILVCRPEINDGRSLLPWYTEFVELARMDPSHVLVLLHYSTEVTNDEAIAEFRLPRPMDKLPIVLANIQREGENLRLEFNSFLCKIISDSQFGH